MRKTGFTLVELSIAIVIVGLLIGGILVGQSLIESAKINGEVRRLTQYSIAFNSFRLKFKQEAGDTILFPYPGNNDGNVGDDYVGPCPSRTVESYSAWSHLSQAQMLKGETYAWPNNACSVIGVGNYPFDGITPTNKKLSKLGAWGAYPWATTYKYYYTKAGVSTGSRGTSFSRIVTILPPEMIWALENKIDDNDALGGNITSLTTYDTDNVQPCSAAGLEDDRANAGITISDYEPYRFCTVSFWWGKESALGS